MTYTVSRRGVLAAAGAAAGTTLIGTPAAATNQTGGIAFTHVTVIDPGLGRPQHDTTVVVRDGLITAVGRGRVPPGTRVVNARGRYLIPGLADMHTHAYAEQIDLPLYLANGVTTVREMSGSAPVHDWRRRIDAGTLLGPRYAIGSRIVDGAPSIWDPAILNVIQVADAAQARRAVRDEVAAGADFIKVYSRLSRPAYYAIAAEARRLGVPFAGHCPDDVAITEAARLGQASVEHLFSTAFDTSTEEAAIRAALRRLRLDLGDYSGWFAAVHPLEWTAAHTYSPAKARRLYATFAERRTRQVPTLVMHHGLDHARTLDMRGDPRARYLPGPVLAGLEYALHEMYLADRAPADDARWAAMFDHRMRTVGEMHRAGVPLMVGTDTGTCGVYPGFSVHDELAFLVRAGLTPMAALHAATVEPARYLRSTGGRIARGHAADLVLLDANPLDDIRHTQRIAGVLVRGRYLDRGDLDRMLREVEEAAAAVPAGAAMAAACACR